MKDKEFIRDLFRGGIMVAIAYVIGAIVVFLALTGCSPKIVEKIVTETKTEYRDRVIHDTTTFTIEKEVERVVTRDTSSHLENSYAKSDAIVSGGFLSHTLESIPQEIKVPYEVTVHDTVTVEKQAEIRTEKEYVEKPLSWWQETRMGAFWWLLAGLAIALAYIFRKPILKLIKKI